MKNEGTEVLNLGPRDAGQNPCRCGQGICMYASLRKESIAFIRSQRVCGPMNTTLQDLKMKINEIMRQTKPSVYTTNILRHPWLSLSPVQRTGSSFLGQIGDLVIIVPTTSLYQHGHSENLLPAPHPLPPLKQCRQQYHQPISSCISKPKRTSVMCPIFFFF